MQFLPMFGRVEQRRAIEAKSSMVRNEMSLPEV